MPAIDIFTNLGISIGLGLLVGMQREKAASPLAGLRTFTLITLLGTIAGLLSQSIGPWIIFAALLAVAISFAAGNLAFSHEKDPNPGITTEIAALIMFCVGAYLVLGPRPVAIAIAGATAVLLWAKPILHSLVQRLGDNDLRAMMQLVIIALIILPILPNQAYGPFAVLNPRQIWWMVVLIAAISFAGYVVYRALGDRAGTLLAGILGGVISSTATTVSYARRSRSSRDNTAGAVLVILLAGTVVYVRVLIEIAAAAPQHLLAIGLPVAVTFAVSALLSLILWLRFRHRPAHPPDHENPIELRSAVAFGIIYALVLFAAAAAHHYFQNKGIYVVAAISGLTDMDAITLSSARLAAADQLSTHAAWRSILIGAIANMTFKAAVIAALASRRLFLSIAFLFLIKIILALALILFWPISP